MLTFFVNDFYATPFSVKPVQDIFYNFEVV